MRRLTLKIAYPSSPAAGSPFGTGLANEIYPQYKRLAALIGDLTFTLTRRGFLSSLSTKYPHVRSYSYLNTYLYNTSSLGTSHGSDIAEIFGSAATDPVSNTIQSYYLSFVGTTDPNEEGRMEWPLWNAGLCGGGECKHLLMNFTKGGGASLLEDSFRNESYTVLINNEGSFRF